MDEWVGGIIFQVLLKYRCVGLTRKGKDNRCIAIVLRTYRWRRPKNKIQQKHSTTSAAAILLSSQPVYNKPVRTLLRWPLVRTLSSVVGTALRVIMSVSDEAYDTEHSTQRNTSLVTPPLV